VDIEAKPHSRSVPCVSPESRGLVARDAIVVARLHAPFGTCVSRVEALVAGGRQRVPRKGSRPYVRTGAIMPEHSIGPVGSCVGEPPGGSALIASAFAPRTRGS
jgi:hypothetical protein